MPFYFVRRSGLCWLQSTVLDESGVTHAFLTRQGGVSDPPFDSLNLGSAVGDAPSAVSINRRRVANTFGISGDSLRTVRQVHGTEVVSSDDAAVGDIDESLAPAADGIVSTTPGDFLVVRTADCVPVLMSTRTGRAVAAVHAGWRGLVAGVLDSAVERLTTVAACSAADVLAAVGPAISPAHYAVGSDVSNSFQPLFRQFDESGQSSVDLAAKAVDRLHALQLFRIDVSPFCTYRDRRLFFSYRRDNGRTGRQWSLITAR